MKHLLKFLLFSLLLTNVYHAEAVYIRVIRTTTMGGPNGYQYINGWNTPVYAPNGTLDHIDQTINCYNPGNENCPTIVFMVTNGDEVIEGIEDNGLTANLILLSNHIVTEIDAGTESGTRNKTVCVISSNITTCYLITATWSSSVNPNGERVDEIIFNYQIIS